LVLSTYLYVKLFYLISVAKFVHHLVSFIPFPAHLCSYSTFQFRAFARLFQFFTEDGPDQ